MDAKVGDLRFSGDLIDSFSSKKKSSYTKLKPSLGDAERPQSSESCVIDLRQVERARREGRSRRSKKAKKEKGSVRSRVRRSRSALELLLLQRTHLEKDEWTIDCCLGTSESERKKEGGKGRGLTLEGKRG